MFGCFGDKHTPPPHQKKKKKHPRIKKKKKKAPKKEKKEKNRKLMREVAYLYSHPLKETSAYFSLFKKLGLINFPTSYPF